MLFLLLFIIYLIIYEYFNRNVRKNITNNIQTTSTQLLDENIAKIECDKEKVYCANDYDCLQICSNAISESLKMEYKCNEINTCIQSPLKTDHNSDNETCNIEFGFLPILTADEIFQPTWTCLNTQPYLFDKTQQFHSYICAGGDRSRLDPKNIFNSCLCRDNKIKVRDEFRNEIPICIDKNQLSLFPNFTT